MTIAAWILFDLDTAGQVASVIGRVTGIAGLALALLQPGSGGTGHAYGPCRIHRPRQVEHRRRLTRRG
ncbi:hypothetical protein JL475_37670 [Streptomyces sp. M2CJ-2]|uniref:hypothetical protein n=1 Tax=Streptomyces sp. M2CJ-2 TaxID=2803948 RepID=UPI00192879E4|nr:hypothetical protein [Streptomyces sp. M2CJ-2]MBL3671512.1 hypothetical protein [Streptomyces sp. M2CJ-2]